MIDMRLALMEPTDLRGYPFRNAETNQMEWAPPADLPSMEQAELYDTDCIVLRRVELSTSKCTSGGIPVSPQWSNWSIRYAKQCKNCSGR